MQENDNNDNDKNGQEILTLGTDFNHIILVKFLIILLFYEKNIKRIKISNYLKCNG